MRSLRTSIDSLPGVGTLRHPPEIFDEEVGERIVQEFEKQLNIPTLFFVDPFGYKGLSLKLINTVVRDWACECIFFFNYNRINMGLSNPFFVGHMDALFGSDRAHALRNSLVGVDPLTRERLILRQLILALKGMGGKHVLPFRFKHPNGKKTSHYLVFVTKHPLGTVL